MVVKRFIPRENGVVVADIDVEAKRRAGAVIPSIECDDSPDRDTKEESSDEDSPLSELSSPETPPQFQSVADRFRSYRSKPPPTAWRKTSHVVSGRTTKDTPVVNSNKPKIKIVGKWAKHLECSLPPFNVAREITFLRELTPTKPRRHSVPHSMPKPLPRIWRRIFMSCPAGSSKTFPSSTLRSPNPRVPRILIRPYQKYPTAHRLPFLLKATQTQSKRRRALARRVPCPNSPRAQRRPPSFGPCWRDIVVTGLSHHQKRGEGSWLVERVTGSGNGNAKAGIFGSFPQASLTFSSFFINQTSIQSTSFSHRCEIQRP